MADSGSNIIAEAIEAFKSGNMDEALPLLRQAIAENPDSFELRVYHGLALGRVNRWADAEREFGNACDLNGASADAAYFQGVAIAKQGRLREAHGMFVVALANDPEHKGAKQASEKTAGAAAEATKQGSSAAMPGGLAGIDISAIDPSDLTGMGTRKAAEPVDDVTAALAEMGGGGAGGKRPAAAANIKVTKKAGGCGSLVSLLLGLGLLLAWAAQVLAAS